MPTKPKKKPSPSRPKAILSLAEVEAETKAEERARAEYAEAAYQKARREKARRHLIDFAAFIKDDFIISAPHRILAEKLEQVERGEVTRLIVNFPRRHGKQIADSTPMLTANRGWTIHGDLKEGDFVYGVDGVPVRIVAVSLPESQDCKVTFQNGAELFTHENHEWKFWDRANKRWIEVETRFFFGRNRNSNERLLLVDRHSTYLLPKRSPLIMPEAKLPIHPYAFGVWLGDGRSKSPDFCFSERDRIVHDSVLALGYVQSWYSKHKTTGVHYAGFKEWGKPLRELGVIRAKHIPRCYFESSISQRMELLAGLIDTDGHTDPGGCRVRIVTVSDRLRDDIIELLFGLGFNPYFSTQAPSLSSSGIQGRLPVHCVGFSADKEIPCRIPRKRITLGVARNQRIGLKSVERCSPVSGRCIQVENKDGLYLVGRELIPTHNSLLVSQLFPCWCFGRNPKLKFVQCGYAESLTVAHSRKARDILAGDRFHLLWPDIKHRPGTVSQDRVAVQMQTAHEWGTGDGGSYYAVGVGGGLSGRGYSVGIIDDPIRGREDAASRLKRDKVYDWYRSVFYPAQDSDSIKQNAAIIVVMTRWHGDDLAARVQQVSEEFGEGDPEKWDVLTMPAINDNGEALWPERWPIEKLNKIKQIIGSREFSAQYQQSPRPDEGQTLDSRLLVKMSRDQLPKMTATIRRWDLAFSEAKGADYVAGVKMGKGTDGKYYILDVKRIHGRWTQSKPTIVQTALDDGVECVCAIEANGTQLGYFQDMLSDSRLQGRSIIADKPKGTKEMRASVWGSRLIDGLIGCVIANWNVELFDEMDYFPNGEHDDMVDGVSGAFTLLGEPSGVMSVEDLREQAVPGAVAREDLDMGFMGGGLQMDV